MVRALLAKLRHASPFHGWRGRPDRVSILLPFLIISLGLGALAWRSYYLSVKMERGASAHASLYATYAAELAARQMDAAAGAEFARVAEEWQQLERGVPEPTFKLLLDWVSNHEWILSAAYIPDYDPASGIYATEINTPAARLTREFFTATGTMRYDYDPQRLLARVQSAIKQQPLVRTSGRGAAIQQE